MIISELTQQDKSNYLKGLLILAKKDRRLIEQEKNIIRKVARDLGFASDFYEYTLKNLLINQYIFDEPVKFTKRSIAEYFIVDAVKLAQADHFLSASEIECLKNIAAENEIEPEWLEDKISKYQPQVEVLQVQQKTPHAAYGTTG